MTSLATLFAWPVVTRVGWMLVHSLWEVALVGALLAGVLFLLKRRSANARYLAGCIALGLMAALPGVTLLTMRPADPAAVAPRAAALTPAGDASGHAAPGAGLSYLFDLSGAKAEPPRAASAGEPWRARVIRVLEANLSWIVGAWAAGVCVLSLRIVAGWIGAQRLRRRCCRGVSDGWQGRLAELAGRIGVSRPVQLLESGLAEVPTVIGHLRPVILLPVAALTGLTPQHVEAILAHELAHIRRHDYLVNLVQVVIETLLFYHPAMWWVSRRIRIERENCCDDIAIGVCGDRFGYIRALVSLEELRDTPAPRLAVAWQGTSLVDRARRLLGVPGPMATRSQRWMAGPVFLVVALAIMAGLITSAVASQDNPERDKAGVVGAVTSAPASTPATRAGREGVDSVPAVNQPHWERYNIGKTRKDKDGREVAALVPVRPSEFGGSQGDTDKNSKQIAVEVKIVHVPASADLEAAAKIIGKGQAGRVWTASLYPTDRRPFPPDGRPFGTQAVLKDAISPTILSAEQVQKFLKMANGWQLSTVLSGPRVVVRERQNAWVEVQQPLTDWPIAEQKSGVVSRFDIPLGTSFGVSARAIPADLIEVDFLVRFAEVLDQESGRGIGGRIGAIEGGMRGTVDLQGDTTVLMRVPAGRSWAQCYRKRAEGTSKDASVEILMEPIEGGEAIGPVYVLITPRILKPGEATARTTASGSDVQQGVAGEQASGDINAKMAQLDMSNATLEDIRRIFGEPTSYMWDGKTLDKDDLPERYVMVYPGGMQVTMVGGRINEIGFEGPSDYAYRGLRFGSTWQDVVQVLGEPAKTVQGLEWQAGDSVLYKDAEGRKGLDSYCRLDLGLWVVLQDGKVGKIALMPTQPPAIQVAFDRDAVGKIDRVPIGKATREDVLREFGKPDSYWWGGGKLDESALPQAYLMQYPGGLTFMMNGHQVQEVRIEGGQTRHPSNYAFRGSLRVGSSMQDALNVLGQPTRTVEGGPMGFEDGVLYKNVELEGRNDIGYYSRSDQGVRIFFVGDKVLSMYLTRVEPADDPVQAADMGTKLSKMDINTATRDDVVGAMGRPVRYSGANNGDVDENNLPDRYVMSYANGVQVGVNKGQVTDYVFRKPTSYAYQGVLRVGSNMEEVKQVLGEPKRVAQGNDLKSGFEDGVLYTDCEGMKGCSLYARNDLGIRVVLLNDRVSMMVVMRPQAAQGATGSPDKVP